MVAFFLIEFEGEIQDDFSHLHCMFSVVQPPPPPSHVRSSKRALAWKSLGAGGTNSPHKDRGCLLHQQSWNNLQDKQIVSDCTLHQFFNEC